MRCFRCGVCCTRYQVQLSMAEAKRIAAGIGISMGEFMNRYADPRWPGTKNILVRKQNGACAFLQPNDNKSALCLIHNLKPLHCRQYTASLSQSECREGLATYWHLTVSPSGELQGSDAKLAEYHHFLESLE